MPIQAVYTDFDGLNASRLLNWLINPMTQVERLALSLGPGNEGYYAYDTDDNVPYIWDGTQWNSAGGGGVTDHGALTGLADDDHLQYHTDARGDVRYAPLVHTHVKADITDFAHTHVKADITDFAHTHVKADITDFAHTHVIADITDYVPNTFTEGLTDTAGTVTLGGDLTAPMLIDVPAFPGTFFEYFENPGVFDEIGWKQSSTLGDRFARSTVGAQNNGAGTGYVLLESGDTNLNLNSSILVYYDRAAMFYDNNGVGTAEIQAGVNGVIMWSDNYTKEVGLNTTGLYYTEVANGNIGEQTLIVSDSTGYLTHIVNGTDGDILTLASGIPTWSSIDLSAYFNKSTDDTDDITEGATNKFATAAEKTKLSNISITQPVDLDTLESDTATNNAKVTNATHTGEVTGATALTLDKTAITNKTVVTAASGDKVLIADASDSENLKYVLVSTLVAASDTNWAITDTTFTGPRSHEMGDQSMAFTFASNTGGYTGSTYQTSASTYFYQVDSGDNSVKILATTNEASPDQAQIAITAGSATAAAELWMRGDGNADLYGNLKFPRYATFTNVGVTESILGVTSDGTVYRDDALYTTVTTAPSLGLLLMMMKSNYLV